MPIKWKKAGKFDPTQIVNRILSIRTLSEDGKASYSGLAIDECISTLYSMLQFPSAAEEIDKSTLIWRVLNRTGKDLTAESFISAANRELNDRLETRQAQYMVLTSISISSDIPLRNIVVSGCHVKFLKGNFPKRFRIPREIILKKISTETPETPSNYCKVIITVNTKSPISAYHKAMRAIDLIRSVICLIENPSMQISFGAPSISPINTVQPGGHHTVHLKTGETAIDEYWFEPYFKPKSAHTPDDPKRLSKLVRRAAKGITKSKLEEPLTSSLIMYVRGFDMRDHNSAFLKAWGALEMLTTPDIANYDKLIKRTSFLFKESDYQKQILEHLRSYRNANIHTGEESENARIHCYQIQKHYRAVIWFCIGNSNKFETLDELGEFLDLPTNTTTLEKQVKKLKSAIKFRTPR